MSQSAASSKSANIADDSSVVSTSPGRGDNVDITYDYRYFFDAICERKGGWQRYIPPTSYKTPHNDEDKQIVHKLFAETDLHKLEKIIKNEPDPDNPNNSGHPSSWRCYAMDAMILQWYNNPSTREDPALMDQVTDCIVVMLLDFSRVNVVDGLLGLEMICEQIAHHIFGYAVERPRMVSRIVSHMMKRSNLILHDPKNPKNPNDLKSFPKSVINEEFWAHYSKTVEVTLFELATYFPSDENYFYLKQLYSHASFEPGSKIYYLPFIAMYRNETDIELIESVLYKEHSEDKNRFGLEWQCAMNAIAHYPHARFWDYLMDFYHKIYQYISKVHGETVPDHIRHPKHRPHRPNRPNGPNMPLESVGPNDALRRRQLRQRKQKLLLKQKQRHPDRSHADHARHAHHAHHGHDAHSHLCQHHGHHAGHGAIRGLSESESESKMSDMSDISDYTDYTDNSEDSGVMGHFGDDGKDDEKSGPVDRYNPAMARIMQAEGGQMDELNDMHNMQEEPDMQYDPHMVGDAGYAWEHEYKEAIKELDDIEIHACLIRTLCAYAQDRPVKYGTVVASYIDHLLDIKKINTSNGFYEDKCKEVLFAMPYDCSYLKHIFTRIWEQYYFISWQYVGGLLSSWKDVKHFKSVFLMGTLTRREPKRNESVVMKIAGEKGVLRMIYEFLYDANLRRCITLLKNEYNIVWLEPPYYDVYRRNVDSRPIHQYSRENPYFANEPAILQSIQSVLDMFIEYNVKERFLLYKKLKELKYISYLVTGAIVPEYDELLSEGNQELKPGVRKVLSISPMPMHPDYDAAVAAGHVEIDAISADTAEGDTSFDDSDEERGISGI